MARDGAAMAYAVGMEQQSHKQDSQRETTLLIVDDDPGIRELLSRYLGEQGFAVHTAAEAGEMDAVLAQQNIDLIILDLMLPGEDGLSIARRLQTSHRWPVIMLSARGEEMDRIIGLEVGADDYLPKPFNPRELLARIRAVLRRQGKPCREEEQLGESAEVYRFADFTLNVGQRQLRRSGEDIALTTGEFNLLHAFVEHPDRALSRDQLVDFIKGYDRSPFDRSIDVRVTRLRQKIEDDPKSPRFIHTIWGVGYMFTPKGKDR